MLEKFLEVCPFAFVGGILSLKKLKVNIIKPTSKKTTKFDNYI